MKTIVKVGGGSVTGSMHKDSNRNNQDSFAFREGDGYIVGVVADGCGSSHRSEFGAHLVAYRIAESLHASMAQAKIIRSITKDDNIESLCDHFVTKATNDALSSLDYALRTRHGNSPEELRHFSETLYEYGLCTLLIMIVTDTFAGTWGVGDGAQCLLLRDRNGLQPHFMSIEPCDGNKPPYLGYRLDPRTVFDQKHLLHPIKQSSLAIGATIDCEVVGLAIMSDGFKKEHQEHISTILSDHRFIDNPHKATQILNRLNAGKQKINWEERRVERQPSTFEDDATIVFVQFHKVEEGVMS